MTVATARGHRVPVFWPSGSRDYLSPPGIRYGGAGPAGPVILVASGAARSDGFTCYAAVAGPGGGGRRQAAT